MPGKTRPTVSGSTSPSGCAEHSAGQLGGAVDLLQVDPDRAEEAERVGAERRAAGIDEPGAAQPELIAQRRVDQHFADRPLQPQARPAPACPRPRSSRRARRRRGNTGTASASATPNRPPCTVTAVSVFSQKRGGASAIVGPSSRRSRVTVSGCSGKLQVNPTQQMQRQREQRIADPRHRQIGQMLVVGADVLGRGKACGRRSTDWRATASRPFGREVVPEV